jgi:DHA2 family multidrug resistance protein
MAIQAFHAASGGAQTGTGVADSVAEQPAAAVAPGGEIAPLHGFRLAFAGFALSLANFIVVLDITIANVSVPHIAGGLAISPSQGTWVITSYAIAEAITVPLTGWLAARFGTVRWLALSLLGFGLASFLCGISRSIELLVVYRVLQGLAGGPLMPLTQTMLMRVFPRKKLTLGLTLWSMTSIAAPIVGPVLGGTISDNWGWPWIFFLNLPVIAVCVFVIGRMLARFETPRIRLPIDRVGLVLLIIGIASFQLMLDNGREHDWFASDFVAAMGVIAAIAIPAFIIWEWFDPQPVVNLRLLKDRTLAISTISISLGYGAFFASVVLVPLWLQEVMGYTGTQAGYIASCIGLVAITVSPIAAFLIGRADPRLISSFGILWLAITTMMRLNWNTNADFWAFATVQMMQGIGMPFFFIGLTTFGMANIKPDHVASAAGLMTFCRTISAAISTATVTTLWDMSTKIDRAALVTRMNDPVGAMDKLRQGGLSNPQAQAALDGMVEMQASTNAVLHVSGLVTIILLIAAVSIWLAPKPAKPLEVGPGH